MGRLGTFDAIGRRTLGVFEAIAHARHKYGGRAIGEYIVSGAQGPADVLAVLLLARWADIADKRTGECPLDVAPLLESIAALEYAGDVLRRLAVGMQAVIPMVFVLGFPRETFVAATRIEAMFAAGGFAYIAFALLATIVTDASARRLVVSELIREFSIYLRAVAAMFDPETDLEAAYGAAVRQHTALSEQLQSARALLLDRARRGSKPGASPPRSAFCSTHSMRSSPRNATSRSFARLRRRLRCSTTSARRCASARLISTTSASRS